MQDHCAICGTTTKRNQRRFQTIQSIQALVSTTCTPTPLTYASITSLPTHTARLPICIPCVNWRRRTEARVKSGGSKQMLQLDQTIAFILYPRSTHEPDPRCVARMIAALSDPVNIHRQFIPPQALEIIGKITKTPPDIHSIVLAWWEFNNRTEFFSSPKLAKVVRAAVRNEPAEAHEPGLDELV